MGLLRGPRLLQLFGPFGRKKFSSFLTQPSGWALIWGLVNRGLKDVDAVEVLGAIRVRLRDDVSRLLSDSCQQHSNGIRQLGGEYGEGAGLDVECRQPWFELEANEVARPVNVEPTVQTGFY
ncbi:hypothetical protein AWC24_04210 [Mycolicibacter senuensis]|nr:hypothetical protein AWC24_04210 [Mycolicibacter senuensis]